jgi:hypothetical protein
MVEKVMKVSRCCGSSRITLFSQLPVQESQSENIREGLPTEQMFALDRTAGLHFMGFCKSLRPMQGLLYRIISTGSD